MEVDPEVNVTTEAVDETVVCSGITNIFVETVARLVRDPLLNDDTPSEKRVDTELVEQAGMLITEGAEDVPKMRLPLADMASEFHERDVDGPVATFQFTP